MRIQFQAPTKQGGATLIVALMFLVMLTIIGVSSISTTTLEEKMAGNLRDQQIAFQAAESALRDAEIDLETGIGGTGNRDPLTIGGGFGTACSGAFTAGSCIDSAYVSQTVGATWNWTDANKTVQYGAYTGAAPLPGVSAQPRYVIEYLSEKDDTSTTPTTRHFRITARGWGANASTTATLQTVYRMPLS